MCRPRLLLSKPRFRVYFPVVIFISRFIIAFLISCSYVLSSLFKCGECEKIGPICRFSEHVPFGRHRLIIVLKIKSFRWLHMEQTARYSRTFFRLSKKCSSLSRIILKLPPSCPVLYPSVRDVSEWEVRGKFLSHILEIDHSARNSGFRIDFATLSRKSLEWTGL